MKRGGNIIFLAVVLGVLLGFPGQAGADSADSSLVLHYLFDRDPGVKALDLSGYGNHGTIDQAEYLPAANGNPGALRFDGRSSSLDLGNPEALRLSGDMSLVFHIRRHRELEDGANALQSLIIGEYPNVGNLMFGWVFYHTLLARYSNRSEGSSSIIAANRELINQEWSYIVLVFEFPRFRMYKNGALLQDGNMPVPGVYRLGSKFIGGMPPKAVKGPLNGNWAPVDIAEVRLYKRALGPLEIARLTSRQAGIPAPESEVQLRTDWYKNKLQLLYSLKNQNIDQNVVFTVKEKDKVLTILRSRPENGSGNDSLRMVARAELELTNLAGRELTVTAESGGFRAENHCLVEKPEWIHCDVGLLHGVPQPWTPIKLQHSGGKLQADLYGRSYVFNDSIFPEQIRSQQQELLQAPMLLQGKTASETLAWQAGPLQYELAADATVLKLQQTWENISLRGVFTASLEYDGYLRYHCELQAKVRLSLDHLALSVPLQRQEYCAASFVYPQNRAKSMSESYWDSIKGDLDFLFSPSIWLGGDEIGLTWQAESDQYWRNSDRQRAIRIQQTDGTTSFHANFIDQPVLLEEQQRLLYEFAWQATPIKPMLQDAWSLRVMRCLYGAEFRMPDNTVNRMPELEYLQQLGVRRLYIATADCWPWPMPVHEEYAKALRRLNESAHKAGLKLHPYLLHIRFPVMGQVFSDYGRQLAGYPIRPYMHKANLPPVEGNPRPGPISMEWGAEEQGTVIYCPKSRAAQDAYIYSLDQRFTAFADDGVYLDGTGQVMPCSNQEHGCGYIDAEGKLRPTYPVFASREFSRRIYLVAKRHNPENMVDLHYWHPNSAQAAYADLLWTGEQWHQLKHTGAKYVAGELTPTRFRTMFMGYQIGTAMELMSYRLGSTRRVAAISLLHDVPVRLNQGGGPLPVIDKDGTLARELPQGKSEDCEYFELLPKLWKIRDDFGMTEARKLFYWKNQEYVSVQPAACYATLFVHPQNGILALVSNLSREKQEVEVQLQLDKLGQLGARQALLVPENQSIPLQNGKLILPLASEDYQYIWIK